MAKDPAFPFYAQDFLTGVLHLDFDLRGRYITLLAYQWSNGDVIPKKRLGFLIGFTWETLDEELKEKFEDKGDFIVNKRLLEEREKRNNFKNKQSLNGKKGGRPRKEIKPNKNPKETQKKPLENESEYEYVNEIEVNSFEGGVGETLTPYEFLKEKNLIEIQAFEMQNKNRFKSFDHFVGIFNNKIYIEELEYKYSILKARLDSLLLNWKFEKEKSFAKKEKNDTGNQPNRQQARFSLTEAMEQAGFSKD